MPIVAMPDNTQVSFPDDMPDDQIRSLILQKFPEAGGDAPDTLPDVLKSGGIGLAAKGPIAALGLPGDLSEYGARGLDVATRYIGNKFGLDIPERPNQEPLGGSAQIQRGLESVTGPLYQPKTTEGKYAGAVGEMLGNPLSYVGPGSLALKLTGASLAGAGGEAGGQAAEGTALEIPARLAGGLAGGVAAVKVAGKAPPKAAIPTESELKASKNSLYKQARNSDFEVSGNGLGLEGYKWKQELGGPEFGFTSHQNDAPRTFAILDQIEKMPRESIVTAANLDTIRKQINNITRETRDFKPTPDAAAASILKDRFAKFIESPYPTDVLAGDAKQYTDTIKSANATNAAFEKTRRVNRGIDAAKVEYEGNIASRLDSQLKSQVTKPILKDAVKGRGGFSADELAAVNKANRGDIPTRVLSEFGRGGAGVVPLMGHVLAAIGTGGATLPYQIPLGIGLYGARKLAEYRTSAAAKALAEEMAKNSPLYRKRLGLLQPPDLSGNTAAVFRGLLGGL